MASFEDEVDAAQALVAQLEARVQMDEGGRGIAEIVLPPGELFAAAQTLCDSHSVAIISGFPCMLDHDPPTETDGPLGALAIARACLALGKSVVLLTDECNEEVFLACCAASGLDEPFQQGLLSLASFPGLASFDAADARRLRETCADVDLVVAIERAGPAADGCYYTMRGRDMSALVAPLDDLLQPVAEDEEQGGEGEEGVGGGADADLEAVEGVRPRAAAGAGGAPRSICIGDGGNEVGMGKIYARIVASSIPNARLIACVVPCDHLVVCSVSNWGGYALAAAAAVCTAHQQQQQQQQEEEQEESGHGQGRGQEQRQGRGAGQERHLEQLLQVCLPSADDESRMCERIVQAGARDGLTGASACMVDGMPLQASLDVLRELGAIARGGVCDV